MSALTRNNEVFAQALFAGDSQRQAYYKAYPKSKEWSAANVDSKACVLANSQKIQARLYELQGKAEKQAVLDKVGIIQEFEVIAQSRTEKTRDRLRALEDLAKCYGMFIEKHEATVNAVNLSAYSDEELQGIINAINTNTDNSRTGESSET